VKIALGVADIPYRTTWTPREIRTARWRFKRAPWQRLGGTATTGDVAEILEKRYSLFSMFSVLRGADIVSCVEHAIEDKLEVLLLGGPSSGPAITDADLGPIEEAFRESIDRQEYDSRISGVPTAAAEAGVNHRLKHPYAKGNPPRPSFLDTGALQANFKAWVTE
jgi:hypothetical protein